GQVPGSLKEALAVCALNALVGNINQDGGVFGVPDKNYIQWPEVQTDDAAAAGLATPRLDGAGTADYPYARSLPNHLIKAVLDSPDKLQALLIAGANPCYTLPDAAGVREAVSKVPFVVSFSSFMDETTVLADLVLPNHIYLERLEDVPVTAGLVQSIVGLSQPVVEPQFDTRHLGDTIIAIARAMQGSVAEAMPWDDYETCLQGTLEDQWDALAEQGYMTLETQPEAVRFTFMDGTIGAAYLADAGSPEGDAGSFPMQLMPYDTIRLSSSRIGNPPFMTKTVPAAELEKNVGLVELNVQTADRMGLSQGQRVRLSTPRGEAVVRVHLSQGIAPDIVAMPRGLGHTAYDGYLAGKGVNINDLIGPVEDPASGMDSVYAIRAKLAKA
ncbi:MAG: molybdopterin dinucleotide binding domain-containing protein, partial [Desulfosarcinaceae bacterium]